MKQSEWAVMLRKIESVAGLESYERFLYSAFNEKSPENWLCENYIEINEGYRSKIPYSSQSVYAVYSRSGMSAGIALNFDMTGELQLTQMGFGLDRCEMSGKYKYCEILSLASEGTSLKSLFLLRSFLMRDLVKKKIDFALTTSSEKTLQFYLRFGCSVLQEKISPFGKRYLLKLNIGP